MCMSCYFISWNYPSSKQPLDSSPTRATRLVLCYVTSHQGANQQGLVVAGLLIGLSQMRKAAAEASNGIQIKRDGFGAASKLIAKIDDLTQHIQKFLRRLWLTGVLMPKNSRTKANTMQGNHQSSLSRYQWDQAQSLHHVAAEMPIRRWSWYKRRQPWQHKHVFTAWANMWRLQILW